MDQRGQAERQRFEGEMLAHLDAAFALANWILRNREDAADVVQESYLRAWRHFAGKRDGDGKAWLLTIVRNTARSWLGRHRRLGLPGDETLEEAMTAQPDYVPPEDPETLLRKVEARARLMQLLDGLPRDWREVMVLRELEDMSYLEIAQLTGAPIGTVMSRLSRARARLREEFFRTTEREDADGLP